jgi:uncharacterized protein (DUF1684 family)
VRLDVHAQRHAGAVREPLPAVDVPLHTVEVDQQGRRVDLHGERLQAARCPSWTSSSCSTGSGGSSTCTRWCGRARRPSLPGGRGAKRDRESFPGLPYFDYDPTYRIHANVEPAEREHREIATSGEEPYSFTRFATAFFELDGEHSLDLYWLDGYGGGVFLSYADGTSGHETYGACRYLLDTVKGSDLGSVNGQLILDFNFSYNPSCAYDARWVCPLAPPGNRLSTPVRAGERYP